MNAMLDDCNIDFNDNDGDVIVEVIRIRRNLESGILYFVLDGIVCSIVGRFF